ncbi:MAG: Nif3-like dinuclear metal center hexameric protein [Ruminococcaceae bacterium]|nr:Nif3-like dinuclear metal center hexameric protein [Oscillospiraceae bacterium]
MKVKEILDFLNGIAPMETAEHYDNVGLLVGNPEADVNGILVSLDCFDEVIDRAEDLGANLIVTHHPIIFNPLKSVLNDSLVYKLVSKNISVISMHTNLDVAEGGVNDVLCNAIGLYDVKTIAAHDGFLVRIGELDGAEDPYFFAKHLKEVLGGTVKFVAGNRDIKTVMVCSGSGSGFTFDAIANGVDAYVTAEVKHSHFIAAADAGLSLFDAGHFNTEDVIVGSLTRDIAGAFPEIDVNECHFSKIESI